MKFYEPLGLAHQNRSRLPGGLLSSVQTSSLSPTGTSITVSNSDGLSGGSFGFSLATGTRKLKNRRCKPKRFCAYLKLETVMNASDHSASLRPDRRHFFHCFGCSPTTSKSPALRSPESISVKRLSEMPTTTGRARNSSPASTQTWR